MPTVTALSRVRPGRVRVELDGEHWRTLPDDVAALAGLREGVQLDRPRARALARELRHAKALDVATRALHARDLTVDRLDERLAQRGVAPAERRQLLDALKRTGAVDDRRFALRRSEILADRGLGDAAIRDDLARRGTPPELVEEALGALEPETVRAAEVAQRLGGGARAARALARKGFREESIERALPEIVAAEGATALGYEP
jgi:SOS response regulatory protein OraA/RecX